MRAITSFLPISLSPRLLFHHYSLSHIHSLCPFNVREPKKAEKNRKKSLLPSSVSWRPSSIPHPAPPAPQSMHYGCSSCEACCRVICRSCVRKEHPACPSRTLCVVCSVNATRAFHRLSSLALYHSGMTRNGAAAMLLAYGGETADFVLHDDDAIVGALCISRVNNEYVCLTLLVRRCLLTMPHWTQWSIGKRECRHAMAMSKHSGLAPVRPTRSSMSTNTPHHHHLTF
jgi:hypothetical protein